MKKQHNELIKILAEDKEWQTAKNTGDEAERI